VLSAADRSARLLGNGIFRLLRRAHVSRGRRFLHAQDRRLRPERRLRAVTPAAPGSKRGGEMAPVRDKPSRVAAWFVKHLRVQ
jgi:hypothetical protein